MQMQQQHIQDRGRQLSTLRQHNLAESIIHVIGGRFEETSTNINVACQGKALLTHCFLSFGRMAEWDNINIRRMRRLFVGQMRDFDWYSGGRMSGEIRFDMSREARDLPS